MRVFSRGIVLSCIAAAALLIAGVPGPDVRAGNTDYEISYLATVSGWDNCGANDLNDGGTIVGPAWSLDADGYTEAIRAFRWANRKAQPEALGLPDGFTASSALQINNSGEIVGWVAADVYYTDHHAARWDKAGRPTDVHPEGYWLSELWAINKHGDATGVAIDDAFTYFPFLWPHDGDPEALPLDPDVYPVGGWGNSIDKNGNVAGEGYLYAPDGEVIAHAVAWMADGSFVDLHEDLVDAIGPEIRETRAWMASDDGTIAGHAFNADEDWVVPWVWSESEGVVLLDTDGHSVGEAWGLAGQAIVGMLDGWYYGYTEASSTVWTPKTVKGRTTWMLTVIPPPAGATGIAACNGNTHGDLCGVIVEDDGTAVPFVAHK